MVVVSHFSHLRSSSCGLHEVALSVRRLTCSASKAMIPNKLGHLLPAASDAPAGGLEADPCHEGN